MQQVNWEALGNRVVDLTERLVKIPSVVDTAGEARVAEELHSYLAEQLAASGIAVGYELLLVEVPKPDSECKAVLAFLKAKEATPHTLALMGHIDTVGLESYGSLAEAALDSEKLKAHYAESTDEQLAEHATSPDWAFGRGWHDMKGGVAAIVEVFLELARSRELPSNLLLLLTPDEESASRGLRALVPEIIRLKEQHGLKLDYVINADYTAPLSEGDDNRYWYSGVVGKLLLGVSVFGKTTHVGETFDGLNSSSLAGYLASAFEHDRKLMVGVGGEWLPPPTVLRVADHRERYDVMTTASAELYVNVFHLGGEAEPQWQLLLNQTRHHVKQYDREMRKRYNRFVARADQELPRFKTKAEVIGFSELVSRVNDAGKDATAEIARLQAETIALYSDERDRANHVIRGLHGLLPPGRPLVVVSLLPPFYPAWIAMQDSGEMTVLKELLKVDQIRQRRIYPYISDMSYFAFGPDAQLSYWAQESPVWFGAGEAENYAEIAAPVCNIGPFGLGAHSRHERVYLPFLRDTLPRLLLKSLTRLAAAKT